jgi:hypothetical protein
MVPSSFFDSFIGPAAGFLPGLEPLTIRDTAGTLKGAVQGRQETLDEEQKMAAGIAAGDQALRWFIAVDQSGFIQPGDRWQIAQTDGTTWIVQGQDHTIQGRAIAPLCTRLKT